MLSDINEYQRKTCTWSINKENSIPDPHIHTKT